MTKRAVALLVSDMHISKDNIEEYKKNWNEALAVCEENNIKKILFGGDVFQKHSHLQSLIPVLTVQECFAEASRRDISVDIVPGNHDKPDIDEYVSWCDVFAYIPGVHVYSNFHTYDLDDCTFAMFAYWSEEDVMPKKLKELSESLGDVTPDNVILYLHSGVHGALGDFEVPNEIPQKLLKPYKAVYCSHYHNRTKIKNTDIQYIGGSRPHNFGEDEEKGYNILYSDGTIRFIKNQVNTRYVTEEISCKDVGTWENTYDSLYKVRVRINCTSAEADTIDKEKLFQKGANKVEFVTEKLKAIVNSEADIEDKFNTANLKSEYKNFCKEKDIDSTLGMEYLSKME